VSDKHSVLKLQKQHPDASSGWIADQLDCNPAYVRATLYRAGLKCAKNPTKKRDRLQCPKSLMERAQKLRERADELEHRANLISLKKAIR